MAFFVMNPVARIRGVERFENVNGAVRNSFRKTNGKIFVALTAPLNISIKRRTK
jgi:hypothetical protein